MKEKIFFITTFKLCDNNGYLSTQIRNFFAHNGHELVDQPEKADVIVISTCGFDQERENVSVSIIDNYIKKYLNTKKIIICGCLVKINPGLFDLSRVMLIGPKELDKFNEIFNPVIEIEEISGGQIDEQFIDKKYGFPNALYLQICQGCVNNCSYCAIKKAKGYVKSKTVEQITRQVEQGIGRGYAHYMLLADDCGSYGQDLGIDFADLLNELQRFDIRININYFEPGRFQRLVEKINPEVFEKIGFVNIPLQSTSQRILDLMNRKYDAAEIMARIGKLKKNFPNIFFETHVIYGFPGETHDEFTASFQLADYFDSVIYFYYTNRKGVRSSLLPGRLSSEQMIRRTDYILRHPLFCRDPDSTRLPMVLLGYDLNTTELFESIEKSCSQ